MGAPLIPFARPDMIVGQPLTIVSWFPTLSIVCNCEAKQPVLIVGFNAVAACPHCGRGFQIHGVRHDIRTGEPPHFDINIIVAPSRRPDAAAGDGPKPS